MSSDATEEPPPKGRAHVVTLQRVLELFCAVVSVYKVTIELNYLEAMFSHELFGSDDSLVGPLEHRPVFGASPPPCVVVHGTPFRGPPESFQVAVHLREHRHL